LRWWSDRQNGFASPGWDGAGRPVRKWRDACALSPPMCGGCVVVHMSERGRDSKCALRGETGPAKINSFLNEMAARRLKTQRRGEKVTMKAADIIRLTRRMVSLPRSTWFLVRAPSEVGALAKMAHTHVRKNVPSHSSGVRSKMARMRSAKQRSLADTQQRGAHVSISGLEKGRRREQHVRRWDAEMCERGTTARYDKNE
jgi:hypothetical protein